MDELDQFFQALRRWDVARRFVTPSALSQARRKLSHTAFIAVLDAVCRYINDHGNLHTYKGFRVFAIDGSTMRLPDNSVVRDHFGAQRNNVGERAMGRVSLLFDVLNRITYDAILGNFHTGEITMARQHLEDAEIPENSLILMDRGYFDFATLRRIFDNGHHFCIRLRSNLAIYRLFRRNGSDDQVLTLKPPKQNRAGFLPESPFRQSFSVRLVRYRIGQTDYVLMTTLLDSGQYPLPDLGALYHARWQVEESFKVKKCRLQIEHISGATPEIALQDFHARILKECLTSAMLLDVDRHVSQTMSARKFTYKVCITQALAKMKNEKQSTSYISSIQSRLIDQEAFGYLCQIPCKLGTKPKI